MKKTIFDKIVLNNGYLIPQYSLGPSKIKKTGGDTVTGAVLTKVKTDHLETFENVMQVAIEVGFRSFDSSARSGVEAELGACIRNCGLPRKDLYVGTKVNNAMQGYDNTLRDFENSLNKMKLDYVDVYYIHCPVPVRGQYVDTWRALEKIYRSGLARAIAVSNFTVQQLYDIMDNSDIVPVINQKEQHPFYVQSNLLAFERRHGIISQSYSPLGQGKFAFDPRLQWLADKYHKTIAQIILRWHVQMGFMVVTKSFAKKRIQENADVFDFELTPEDMAFLVALNHGDRVWHDSDRFPGTGMHMTVEQALRDSFLKKLEIFQTTDKKKEQIAADFELLMEYQDVDYTKDYVIYVIERARAKYGAKPMIESYAVQEADKVAEEILNHLAVK